MGDVKRKCNFLPILPTVYGEALSYMERLCQVVDAINALTVAFNDGLSAEINQWIEANYNELLLNAVYDEPTETITFSKDDGGGGVIHGGNFERVADFVTDSASRSIEVPLDTPVTAFKVTVTIPPEPTGAKSRSVYVLKQGQKVETLCMSSAFTSSTTGVSVYEFICFPIGNKLLSFSIARGPSTYQQAPVYTLSSGLGRIDSGPIESLAISSNSDAMPSGTMVQVDGVKLKAGV